MNNGDYEGSESSIGEGQNKNVRTHRPGRQISSYMGGNYHGSPGFWYRVRQLKSPTSSLQEN